MKPSLVALVAGMLFGVGLALSGMTQPGKVFGFLDLTGAFDASLLPVMASAIAVLLLPQWIARRARAPLLAERFPNYGPTGIDGRCLGGAGRRQSLRDGPAWLRACVRAEHAQTVSASPAASERCA